MKRQCAVGCFRKSRRPEDSENVEVLNQSYWPPKSTQISFFFKQRCGVKKKDTATIFKIYAPNRISVELTHIVPRWFDLEHQFWKLWPCLFFVTPHNFGDELTFAAMSWLWAVITWPKIIWTPMCHTYLESWVRALSRGPILVKLFFTQISRRSKSSKKCLYLQFSVSTPQAK